MDPEKQLIYQPIDEESDMDEDEKRQKGDWHQQLLSACQKGDLTAVWRCLNKRVKVFYEDKEKWNPLMLTSGRGYTLTIFLQYFTTFSLGFITIIHHLYQMLTGQTIQQKKLDLFSQNAQIQRNKLEYVS